VQYKNIYFKGAIFWGYGKGMSGMTEITPPTHFIQIYHRSKYPTRLYPHMHARMHTQKYTPDFEKSIFVFHFILPTARSVKFPRKERPVLLYPQNLLGSHVIPKVEDVKFSKVSATHPTSTM
jgi:hypothetical protein